MNLSSLTRRSSVRRNILVSRWLKLSNVLAIAACVGAHVPVVELDYADWFSIVSGPLGVRFPVALVPYGTASLNEV